MARTALSELRGRVTRQINSSLRRHYDHPFRSLYPGPLLPFLRYGEKTIPFFLYGRYFPFLRYGAKWNGGGEGRALVRIELDR